MPEQLVFDGFGKAPREPSDPVFFALLPDAPAQVKIDTIGQALSREHGLRGRRTALDRLHVSLCGVRHPRDRTRELVPVADGIVADLVIGEFDAMFDRALSFKNRSGNYPLVLTGGTGQILGLYRALVGRLARAVGGNEHARIEPHVTMLYDPTMIMVQPVEPVRWTVRELVLIHSLRGETKHVILGRWPLEG